MLKLLGNKDWAGEFFLPDQYKNRFIGKLHYSVESGIILEYTIVNDNTLDSLPLLWGILDSGHKCTLVGGLKLTDFDLNYHQGLTTRRGKIKFSYLLVGEFALADKKYHNVEFTLTNLQEFFYPKSRKEYIEYAETPLFSLNAPYGKIEIGNAARFGLVGEEISTHIYSSDKGALEELRTAYSKIQTQYPNSTFMLRKDFEYVVNLKMTDGATIHELVGFVFEIASLFALFFYKPVYPERIVLYIKEEGMRYKVHVLPAMALENRTVKIAAQEITHALLPITQYTVDLQAVLAKWLQIHSDHSTIIAGIQHETNFRDEHTAAGDIVLYAATLESISYKAKVQNSDRYEYPIAKYASDKLKSGFYNIFKHTKYETIGANIARVRNELVHVGKPKIVLPTLSLLDQVKLGQYMQVVIISHILKEIGITKDVIVKYQNKYTI